MDETLRRVDEDGWCVVPEVIPSDEVEAVRDSVLETASRRGERGRTEGVGSRTGLPAYDQSPAPYLADPTVVETASISRRPAPTRSCT